MIFLFLKRCLASLSLQNSGISKLNDVRLKKMGDVLLQSKCRALRTELRDMKYSSLWNQPQVLSGAPEMYLRLVHFLFLEYSPEIRSWLVSKGYTLLTATDLVFVQQVFKIMQTEFGYRPKLTVDNFFKPKFALQKITMCCDLVKLIKDKSKTLATAADAATAKPRTSQIRRTVKRPEQ